MPTNTTQSIDKDTAPGTGSAKNQAEANDPNRIASAGDPPDAQRGVVLADTTTVKVIDGQEAASTDAKDSGAGGLAHPTAQGEIAGGNIAKVLASPIVADQVNTPMTKERAALLSPVGQKIAGMVGRPISEWGLLGEGDTVKGHMLLLDLKTGEKVRGLDQHKIGEGKLYANLRNLPEALTTGDTLEQVLGSH